MKFAIKKKDSDPPRDRIADALASVCREHGHDSSGPENEARFVFNLTGTKTLQAYRRRTQNVFVFSLLALPERPVDLRSVCYNALVRTLSNVLMCAVPAEDGTSDPGWDIYFTTPEGGFYELKFEPEAVYRRLLPIAGSRFGLDNELIPDLPARFWQGSPVVDGMKAYGRELDRLGVLPTPFPLREALSEDSIKHIYKLFGMTGLSYGNLSARERIPELGETTFWMTGRGVNKSALEIVGKDILLVKGFDREAGKALVSMPPVFLPKARVSVDAVEHELIYRTFPETGAIVHIHAWLDGEVPCTEQNYPCGTFDLAEDVTALLGRTETPARAAVGLKNHGLTMTGPDFADIFERLRRRLRTEVRMFA